MQRVPNVGKFISITAVGGGWCLLEPLLLLFFLLLLLVLSLLFVLQGKRLILFRKPDPPTRCGIETSNGKEAKMEMGEQQQRTKTTTKIIYYQTLLAVLCARHPDPDFLL